MKKLNVSERAVIASLLIAVAVLVGADVFGDFRGGASWIHVLIEGLVMVGALSGAFYLLAQNVSLKKDVKELHSELETTRADALKWKSENQHIMKGLGAAIDSQFEKWTLTNAEKEIALLLLKGLSLKDIANVRNTSERTVRQQTLSVYSKSGLAGRAELSAFFLEDLMLPQESPTSPSNLPPLVTADRQR